MDKYACECETSFKALELAQGLMKGRILLV